MKINFSIYFDGHKIQILNEPMLIENLNESFGADRYCECEAKDSFDIKSPQAMAYLWGEVALRLLEGLREAGYDVSTKEAAMDYILPELPSGRWVTEVKRFGKAVKTSPVSIASLGKAELRDLTDELIRFIAEWFSIACEDPATWKERRSKLKSNK